MWRGLLIPSVPDTLGIVNTTQSAELLIQHVQPQAAVDGRSARWESHREERRATLIKVTRRAIHQLGPDASMEEIAVRAGTSKSVFYRYFGDKAGLQKAVGAVVIAQMQASIVAAGQTARTPREGLVSMVNAYLHMAQTSPNVYMFVTQPGESGAQTIGELTDFFEAVTTMISEPLHELLGEKNLPLLSYWPTAAIGLIRSAGELWLTTPPSSSRPESHAMAEQISAWLFDGIWQQMPTSTSH